MANNTGKQFTKHFRLDGTGTINATGDYSVTPAKFYFPVERRLFIHHMTIFIQDTGTMDTNGYGNKLAITNGITIDVEDENGNIQLEVMEGHNVKQNAEWANYAESITHYSFGAGDEVLVAHMEFLAQWGAPLELNRGQRLVINLNDDFTGLNQHEFHAMGVRAGNGH